MTQLIGTNFVGRDMITALYMGYFNRAPEPSGLEYWMKKYEAGTSVEEIAKGFTEASVVFDVYPNLDQLEPTVVRQFVENTYRNFLNREGEPAGVQYWVDKITSGAVIPSNLILEFLEGAMDNDVITLQNKVKIATIHTEASRLYGNYDEDFSNEVLDLVNHTSNSVTRAKEAIKDKFEPEAETITIEIPGETVYITNTVYVDKPIYIDVPVEMDHVLSYSYDASIHATGTKSFAGTQLIVGSGIKSDGKVMVTSETGGFELAMGANYRTGAQLLGDYESDGVIRITANAGHQVAGAHNVYADAANRSAVSFDYTLNTGVVDLANSGYKLQLLIDTDSAANSTDFLVVDFVNTTPLGVDYWAGVIQGNPIPVIGDEVSYKSVIQESTNFGFNFISSQIADVGPLGSGDLAVGEYEVYTQVLNSSNDVVAKVGIIFDLVDVI